MKSANYWFYILLIFGCAFFYPTTKSYCAENYILSFAKSAGGTGDDSGMDVRFLSDGSSVVVGFFSGISTFGKNESKETKLTSYGATDVFVAKYSITGRLEWAKQAGGAEEDAGISVTTDSSDKIIVAGTFRSLATFGKGEANETQIASVGDKDIFIAKFTKTGNLEWAKSAGGTGEDMPNKIVMANSDSVIICGRYWVSAIFGKNESAEITLNSEGRDDIFIAQYKWSGSLEFAKTSGGGFKDEALSLCVTTNGYIMVTGCFQYEATFGKGGGSYVALNSRGLDDIFIAKYKANGLLVWAKSAGGIQEDRGYGIASFSDDSVIITGNFRMTSRFGDSGAYIYLTSTGESDAFFARYNSTGDILWAKKAGGVLDDVGFDIGVMSDGNFAATGAFYASATFNPNETDEASFNSRGMHDIFVAKFSSDGKIIFIRTAGGNSDDYPLRLSIRKDQQVFITGYYGAPNGDSAIFGYGEENQITLSKIGLSDAFIARYHKRYATLYIGY